MEPNFLVQINSLHATAIFSIFTYHEGRMVLISEHQLSGFAPLCTTSPSFFHVSFSTGSLYPGLPGQSMLASLYAQPFVSITKKREKAELSAPWVSKTLHLGHINQLSFSPNYRTKQLRYLNSSQIATFTTRNSFHSLTLLQP